MNQATQRDDADLRAEMEHLAEHDDLAGRLARVWLEREGEHGR